MKQQNIVRTIAPFHVGVAEKTGVALSFPKEYRKFWEQLSRNLDRRLELSEIGDIYFHRSELSSADIQYRDLEHDSLGEKRELITINFRPEKIVDENFYKEFGQTIQRVEEISFRFYPHELGILEVQYILTEPFGESEKYVKKLGDETISATESIAKMIEKQFILTVVEEIELLDKKARFFINERGIRGACANSEDLFWVSRALLATEESRGLMRYWLKGSFDASKAHVVDDIIEGKTSSVVRWLNYGFVDEKQAGVETFRSGQHASEWAGLRHAQEIYSSLDHVDAQLKRVLANVVSPVSKTKLDILKEDLIRLSQRIETIIMSRQELLKYMTRDVRGYFENILDAWEYNHLVEKPSVFKLELCKKRLDEISAARASRAAVVTDLILLGIGITSIASMALAISDFGRNSGADPRATGYDLGASSFTSWFSAQPIDAVLMASAGVSLLLIVFYAMFGRSENK